MKPNSLKRNARNPVMLRLMILTGAGVLSVSAGSAAHAVGYAPPTAPAPTAPAPGGPDAPQRGLGGVAGKDESRLEVVSTGAEPRERFRVAPKVGDRFAMSVRQSMRMETSLNGTSLPMRALPASIIDTEGRVTSVSEQSGEVSLDMSVVSAEIDAGEGVDAAVARQVGEATRAMKGTRITSTLSSSGRTLASSVTVPDSVPREMRDAITQTTRTASDAAVPFPDEPLGVGAVWNAVTPIERSGLRLTQSARYEITEITPERVGLRITMSQQAPRQKVSAPGVEAELLSMDGTGEGTSVLARGIMMPLASTMRVRIRTQTQVADPQGATAKIDQTVSVDLVISGTAGANGTKAK